jgi:chromosome segregation ATPase
LTFLQAQHRAIVTNFHDTKRALANLESQLDRSKIAERITSNTVSIISRKLEFFAHSCTALLSQFAGQKYLLAHKDSVLSKLLQIEAPILSSKVIPSEYSTESTSNHDSSSSEIAEPSATTISSIDDTLQKYFSVLSETLSSLLCLVSDKMDKPVDQLLSNGILTADFAHHVASSNVLVLQDRIAILQSEILELKSQLELSQHEAHRSRTTLERLKYDYPDLDIEAFSKQATPHGVAPAELKLPLSASEKEVQDIPMSNTNPSSDVSNAASVLVVDESSAKKLVELETQISELTKKLASKEDEINTLNEELEVSKMMGDSWKSEMEDLRSQLTSQLIQIQQLQLTPITEESVRGSKWYVALYREAQMSVDKVHELEISLSRQQDSVAFYKSQHEKDAKALSDALQSAESDRNKLVASHSQKANALSTSKDVLSKELNEVKAALMKASSENSVIPVLKNEILHLKETISSMQSHIEILRTDLAKKIGSSETFVEMKKQGFVGSSEQEELEVIKAERDEYITMLSDLSVKYDEVTDQVSKLQEKLGIHEAELNKVVTENNRWNIEKNHWASQKLALENEIQTLKDSQAAHEASELALKKQYEKMKEIAHSKDEKLAELSRESASLKHKLDKPPIPGSSSSLVLTNGELSKQVSMLESRVNELIEKNMKLEHEKSQLSQDLNSANKKILKRKDEMKLAREKSGTPIRIFDDSKEEMLVRYMTCTQCNINLKDTVITKCFHLFCRSCIDVNIKNRNRKCPSCNLTYGESDVHTVYMAG